MWEHSELQLIKHENGGGNLCLYSCFYVNIFLGCMKGGARLFTISLYSFIIQNRTTKNIYHICLAAWQLTWGPRVRLTTNQKPEWVIWTNRSSAMGLITGPGDHKWREVSRVLWKLNLTNWPGDRDLRRLDRGQIVTHTPSVTVKTQEWTDNMITVVHWVYSENCWSGLYKSDSGRRLAMRARYGSYVSV